MRKLKAKKGGAADGYRKEAQGREKCGGPDSGKCGGVARREPPDRIELGDGQDLSRYSERHKNERPLFRQPRLPAEGGKNRVKQSQLSQLSRREHKRRQEPPQTRKARARRRISRHMGGVGRVFLARRLRVGRGRVRRARYMGRNPADHIRHLAAHRRKRLLGQKKMVGGAYPRSYVHSHSVSDLHPRQRRFDGRFRRRYSGEPRRFNHPAHRCGRLRRRS